MDTQDLISRSEAKEILYNCPNWFLVGDKNLALSLLDKVPAVNAEEVKNDDRRNS